MLAASTEVNSLADSSAPVSEVSPAQVSTADKFSMLVSATEVSPAQVSTHKADKFSMAVSASVVSPAHVSSLEATTLLVETSSADSTLPEEFFKFSKLPTTL